MAEEPKNTLSRRPQRIGRYEIIEHIATGGMGAVYKARDTDLDRLVALKVLSPAMAARRDMLDRFRKEARAAAKLRHDNIVAIYDVGEVAGAHFLALEFVEGTDLHNYIKKKRRMSPGKARQVVVQAARALEHAHEQGLVHRDIKPSNFLLSKGKDKRVIVKLADLGLVREVETEDQMTRLTRHGSTIGTVDYMSPEQARDAASADIRSDIYSLGCTLFHMLAGAPPFAKGTMTERLLKHAQDEPPDIRRLNPAVPDSLVNILSRMLAKKPEERYQTPAELLRDLETTEHTPAGTGPGRGINPQASDEIDLFLPGEIALTPLPGRDQQETRSGPLVTPAPPTPAPPAPTPAPPAPAPAEDDPSTYGVIGGPKKASSPAIPAPRPKTPVPPPPKSSPRVKSVRVEKGGRPHLPTRDVRDPEPAQEEEGVAPAEEPRKARKQAKPEAGSGSIPRQFLLAAAAVAVLLIALVLMASRPARPDKKVEHHAPAAPLRTAQAPSLLDPPAGTEG